MKKLILISSLLLCLTVTSRAQTGLSEQAFLFSRTSFGGTARMQALGGAHVSLGGDLSSANINPAGIGFYNRSDLSLTLGLEFQNADARFNGNSPNSTFRTGVGLDNLGIVINKTDRASEEKFKGWNFSISVDRINDFNEEISYSGENFDNSLAFALRNNAFNIENANLRGLESAAFETFVINPIVLANGDIDYDPVNLVEIDDEGGLVFSFPVQEETITRRGSQNQWNFAAGGNFDDKVYFGGGLGVTTINYEQDRVFRESDYVIPRPGNVLENDGALGGLTLRENLNITGVGVNGTIGVILRPIDYLTFGVSYITPTFYTLNEESSFTLTNVIEREINTFGEDVINPGRFEEQSDIFVSNYSLRTPGKLNLGLTAFTGKYGFITGSVEFTDYASATLRSNDFQVAGDNNEIRETYAAVTNFRLGGEFRLDKFRFRAGYAGLRNPLSSEFDPVETNNITFGLGYKTRDYYIDLSVVNSSSNQFYSPYSLPIPNDPNSTNPFEGNTPLISTDLTETRVSLTFGLTF